MLMVEHKELQSLALKPNHEKSGEESKDGHSHEEGKEGEEKDGEHNPPEPTEEIVDDGFGNLVVKNKKLEMRGDYYAIIYLGYIKENQIKYQVDDQDAALNLMNGVFIFSL